MKLLLKVNIVEWAIMASSSLELVTIDSSSQEQKQALFQSIKNYTTNMASSDAKC